MMINGVEREVERVHVVSAGEPWGEVLLEDGTVIRMRLCVLSVHRVLGETAPDGAPLRGILRRGMGVGGEMRGRFLNTEERRQRKLAYRTLSRAIRCGEVEEPSEFPCVDCEDQATEYDHHVDYEPEHWLTVEPVCRPCHRKRSVSRHQHNPKGVHHLRWNGRSAAEAIQKFRASQLPA